MADVVTWTTAGDLRVASYGSRVATMSRAGSRWSWNAEGGSGLDDEETARRRVEQLLLAPAANDAPAPAPPDTNDSTSPPEQGKSSEGNGASPGSLAAAGQPLDLPADGRVERWDVDPWTYQTEREHVRRTHLELLLESPTLYEHHVVRGNPRPETRALRLGRALHVEVLQPREVERLLTVEPDVDKRTNAGKLEVQRWRSALAPEAIVLTPEERQTVRSMAKALRADPVTGALLERDGWRELPLRWVDPETGFPCKVMLDLAFETRDRERVKVLDLKSSFDPSEDAWPRSVAEFGYHRQDAMYRDAAHRYFGRPVDFTFLVVRNKPPFEVAVYDLDEQAVDLGRQHIRTLLRRLERHVKAGDWSAPWQCRDFRPKTISLPPWARKELDL